MGDSDILARILTTKAEEVIAAQVDRPLETLERDARDAAPPRDSPPRSATGSPADAPR
jgi:hypothetical protein